MFQDSVPAGSYNDPFLSSVCVCMGMCQQVVYVYKNIDFRQKIGMIYMKGYLNGYLLK